MNTKIAIVGLGGLFPGAKNPEKKKIDFHFHVKGDSATDYLLIFNIEVLSWKLGLIQRHEPIDDYKDDFSSSGRFDIFYKN